MLRTSLCALGGAWLALGCGSVASDASDAAATSASTTTGAGGGAGTAGATAGATTGTGGSPAATGSGGAAPATFLSSYPLEARFPESGFYDPEGHAFFVGSLDDASVHRIDAATGVDEAVFIPDEPGDWWTLGMTVDVARDRLWVCAMEDLQDTDQDPPYDGYIWLHDRVTGSRQAVFDLALADADASCTDVAVRSDGTVFVTDRDLGSVYRVTVDDPPTRFAASELLEGGVVGQNAIVITPDESALLVAIYLTSRLVRVDLATREVTEVDIDGSFGDLTFLSGADGMTFHEGDLYVVFASELVKLTPTLADWSAVQATEVTVPNGMTDVVSSPHGLYLLNGQAIRFALGQDPDPFVLALFSGTFPTP